MTLTNVRLFTFVEMYLLQPYRVVTVTHHNLNVQEIGHFYLRGEGDNRVSEGIQRLKDAFGFEELHYLETCNRVSYIIYGGLDLPSDFLKSFFKVANPDFSAEALETINKFAVVLEADKAIQHVFELASSMDSLVVGEREIFRQYRQAYENCKHLGHIGDKLRLLEKATVKTAKEVYNNTKIGEKPLSVVSLAMQALLKRQHQTSSKVVLVGGGETNALVAKFLKKYQYSDIRIYNRSLNNAQALAQSVGAESFHIQDLKELDGDFDIIFICTSANKVIIDQVLYTDMLNGDEREKVIIDLAVPRNVSQEVVDNNKVHYIDIESLKKLSEANLEFRKQEVEKARPIIANNIKAFRDLVQERQIEHAMSAVPAEIKAVKARALNEVYRDRIDLLDPNGKALLMEMMDYMEKKCVSIPIKLAKKI